MNEQPGETSCGSGCYPRWCEDLLQEQLPVTIPGEGPYGQYDVPCRTMKLIDNALFRDLCETADESPRRRAHHLIHDSHGEPVQRMLIALQPGTYFRPHRHRSPPKWELVLVLKGIAAWIGFGEDGRVTGRTEAGAHRDCKGLEYPPGTWHSLVCLRADTVIFECKPGPFAPIDAEDFAPWAPEEDAPEAAEFVRWMVNAKVGERVHAAQGCAP